MLRRFDIGEPYFYVLLAGQQVAPKEPNTKAPQAGYPIYGALVRGQADGACRKTSFASLRS